MKLSSVALRRSCMGDIHGDLGVPGSGNAQIFCPRPDRPGAGFQHKSELLPDAWTVFGDI